MDVNGDNNENTGPVLEGLISPLSGFPAFPQLLLCSLVISHGLLSIQFLVVNMERDVFPTAVCLSVSSSTGHLYLLSQPGN